MDLKNQHGTRVQGNANAGENGGTPLNQTPLYDAWIELLNQIYWEGYAEQLASENPEAFASEYSTFSNHYQS